MGEGGRETEREYFITQGDKFKHKHKREREREGGREGERERILYYTRIQI